MRALTLLYCLGILALPTSVLAQREGRPHGGLDNVPPLLRRAIQASHHLRYIGTRIIEFRRKGKDNRHTEYVTRDGDRLRIEFPSGSQYAGQIIVEDGTVRKQFDPSTNEIRELPPRRDETVARLFGLARRHTLAVESGSNVAGKPTEQVVISDAQGNVLQRLFIESHTGAVLKRDVYDAGGVRVGGFEFTDIDLSPHINPSVFRIDRRGATIVGPVDMLKRICAKHNFEALHLKPSSGYTLVWSRINSVERQEVLMEMYAGRDGSRLTLYELHTGVGQDKLGNREGHALQLYSWSQNGASLVLIGNLSQEALQQLSTQVGN